MTDELAPVPQEASKAPAAERPLQMTDAAATDETTAASAWQLILNKLQADDTMGGDPALENILKSLLRITTVFEQHGTGGLK